MLATVKVAAVMFASTATAGVLCGKAADALERRVERKEREADLETIQRLTAKLGESFSR